MPETMHPGTCLLLALMGMLATPFCGVPGLLVLILLALQDRGVAWRKFRIVVWRSRWLLLSLWAIVAYQTPGEAWQGWHWAPTYEGLDESARHVLRLLAILACLAALLVQLGMPGLRSALWACLQPWWQQAGVARLLVRLVLVLELLERRPARVDWRALLQEASLVQPAGEAWLRVEVLSWRWREFWILLGGGCILWGVSRW